MFDVALPEGFHHRQHLAHVGTALLLHDAAGHEIELILKRAAADAELQPSVAEDIEQCRFAGNADRVPVGRDDDRRADRMREVCAAQWVRMLNGLGPTVSSIVWCSAAQAISNPPCSARRTRSSASPPLAHVAAGVGTLHVDGDREFRVASCRVG